MHGAGGCKQTDLRQQHEVSQARNQGVFATQPHMAWTWLRKPTHMTGLHDGVKEDNAEFCGLMARHEEDTYRNGKPGQAPSPASASSL